MSRKPWRRKRLPTVGAERQIDSDIKFKADSSELGASDTLQIFIFSNQTRSASRQFGNIWVHQKLWDIPRRNACESVEIPQAGFLQDSQAFLLFRTEPAALDFDSGLWGSSVFVRSAQTLENITFSRVFASYALHNAALRPLADI